MPSYSKWVEAKPGEDLVAVVSRALRSRLDPVQHYAALAAEAAERDEEYVHQLRVWSRRAAAATQLFREVLPKRRRRWLNQSLKEIRDSAGAARDDDVFARRLETLGEDGCAARLLQDVHTHRSEAQQPIRAVYEELIESGRFERRVRKLLAKVRYRGEAGDERGPRFHDWAVEQLRGQMEPFFEASRADLSDAGALHRFRIAGKRLRYALELLADAFDPSLKSEVYPRIQELQDQLGEINDHAVAAQRLGAAIAAENDPAMRAFLERLRGEEQAAMDALRDRFLGWWNGRLAQELQDQLGRLVV